MMKLYVIVDGSLAPGLQIAQACHAMREFAAQYPDRERAWYSDSNNIVVLEAADERQLHGLCAAARADGVQVAAFREPDRENQLTAVAMLDGGRHVACLPLALRVQRRDAA